MSWIDDILAGNASAGQIGACVVGAPFCLAAHVAERAGTAAERARADASDLASEVRGTIREGSGELHGLIDHGNEAATNLARESTAPLEQVSSTMMWIAIAIGIVAGLIVLGVAIYFLWPVLMGLRSAGL